jgi:hypothetical protein
VDGFDEVIWPASRFAPLNETEGDLAESVSSGDRRQLHIELDTSELSQTVP